LTCHSTAYCWGNFAGPFVVKESQAPAYRGATIGLLVGYAIKAGCHALLLGTFLRVKQYKRITMLTYSTGYMFVVNRRRDRVYGPANKEESDEAGMQDQTEFQNKNFRYVL
jgi:hypothetical protein